MNLDWPDYGDSAVGRYRFLTKFNVGLVLALIAAVVIYFAPQPTARDVFEQGVAAILRHDHEKAERLAQQLRSLPNSETLERVLNGGILAQSGYFREALTELEPTAAKGGLHREYALLWIGESYYGLRDLARSEIVLRTALIEFPNNKEVIRINAAVYYDLGAMYPALTQLEKLKKLTPLDSRPYHMAGAIYLDFEQFDEAVANLKAALDRNPTQTQREEIILDLAVSLRKLLRYQEALANLDCVSSSAKRFAEQALCHLGLGNISDAAACIESARTLQEQSPDLYRAESQLMIEKKQFGDAIIVLEKLAAAEPHDFEVHYKMASVYKQLNLPDDQAEAIKKFESKQSLRSRLTELNQLANQNPYDADLRLQLADTCKQLGRSDLEKIWFEAADACRDIEIQRIREKKRSDSHNQVRDYR